MAPYQRSLRSLNKTDTPFEVVWLFPEQSKNFRKYFGYWAKRNPFFILSPALPPCLPSSFPYLTFLLNFSKGTLKVSKTFCRHNNFGQGCHSFYFLQPFYVGTTFSTGSAVLNQRDFADRAYFIQGISESFTAKTTLLAAQAASVLVGFGGVAAKCGVGQQLNPQK